MTKFGSGGILTMIILIHLAKISTSLGNNLGTIFNHVGMGQNMSKPWYLVNPKIAGIYGCSSH